MIEKIIIEQILQRLPFTPIELIIEYGIEHSKYQSIVTGIKSKYPEFSKFYEHSKISVTIDDTNLNKTMQCMQDIYYPWEYNVKRYSSHFCFDTQYLADEFKYEIEKSEFINIESEFDEIEKSEFINIESEFDEIEKSEFINIESEFINIEDEIIDELITTIEITKNKDTILIPYDKLKQYGFECQFKIEFKNESIILEKTEVGVIKPDEKGIKINKTFLDISHLDGNISAQIFLNKIALTLLNGFKLT